MGLLSFLLRGEEPLLRAGIFSDTHVTAQKSSCLRLKKALELFQKHKVDLVINAGDIADRFDPQAYLNYRNTVRQVFKKSCQPREIFAYANHDWMGKKEVPVRQVFPEVKKHLEIPHEPYAALKIKGIPFVVVPQFADMKRYRSMLEQAVRENPGQPIFVVDHIPPHDTVFASAGQGIERRKLLNDFPQVILICGHKHNTLKSELTLWQGEFTVIHAGCLQNWRLFLTGSPWAKFPDDTVLLMEIFKDKLVLRRFSALTWREIRPEAPRTIPLPFEAARAPFSPSRRRQSAPVPQFSLKDKIKVQFLPEKAVFSFPHAQSPDGVYQYQFELFQQKKGQWERFARMDKPGNFLNPEKNQARYTADIGYFESHEKYLLRITPVNFYHVTGKAVETTFSAPQRKKEQICFESRTPAKDCLILENPPSAKKLQRSCKNWLIPSGKEIRLFFPGDIWKGKAWTLYRFTIEMQLEEFSSLPRFMVLRNPDPLDEATGRILLPREKSGKLRYVFTHSKREDGYNYFLLFTKGGAGAIRFDYVKVELLQFPGNKE